LEADYTSDLNKARAVLAALGQTTLDSSRAEMAYRIRSFVRQAEDSHNRDLAAAAQLAHQARVLAQDLEKLPR
jgi:hypothetical protein